MSKVIEKLEMHKAEQLWYQHPHAPEEWPDVVDTVEASVLALYAPDRVAVSSIINGIRRRAEFTASQVLGCVIKAGWLPITAPISYKVGGRKTIALPSGPEYVDTVVKRFISDHPNDIARMLWGDDEYQKGFTWEPIF